MLKKASAKYRIENNFYCLLSTINNKCIKLNVKNLYLYKFLKLKYLIFIYFFSN